MVRRVFFHVGMPKTGTTAIQESFAAHRAELRRHGLLYPGSAVDHADLLPHFHQRGPQHIYYRNRKIGEAEALAIGERARAEVERDMRGFEGDAILSSEYFYNVGPGRLQQLLDFFGDLGYEFTAVIYIRHPVAAAISHANQDIKMGRRTLRECVDDPRWHSNRKALATLRSVLGEGQLVVRDFEAVKAKNCVSDILNVCGYRGDPDALSMTHTNVSLSMGGAVLADACHKLRAETPPTILDHAFLHDIGGPKFTLPKAAIARVRKRGQSELAWVQEKFGITLAEPTPSGVFSDTLGPEATLALVRHLALLQSASLSHQAKRLTNATTNLLKRGRQ